MKPVRSARICLAVCICVLGVWLLSAVNVASATPTRPGNNPPTLPPILNSPSPSASPTPSPEPVEDDQSTEPRAQHRNEQRPSPKETTTKDGDGSRKHHRSVSVRRRRSNRKERRAGNSRFHQVLRAVLAAYEPSGVSYDTSAIDGVVAKARAAGWSPEKLRSLYRPFILAGPAHWTDTWGAPRFGPRPHQVRTHEGQDVFCDLDTPVLATESGTIEFDADRLGGRIARLHRGPGEYWYYAHLSRWNTKSLSSGDRVSPGDVIGYCGNSGDAIEGPTHVHFGWYINGVAHDPIDHLAGWLNAARRRTESTRRKLELIAIRNNRADGGILSKAPLTLDQAIGPLAADGSIARKVVGYRLPIWPFVVLLLFAWLAWAADRSGDVLGVRSSSRRSALDSRGLMELVGKCRRPDFRRTAIRVIVLSWTAWFS